MSGDTETARAAAQAMASYDRNELQHDLAHEGAYTTVVEGGYHTEALTDDEADFLAELLIDRGIDGLFAYANATKDAAEAPADDRRDVAHIAPLVSTSGSAFEEVISRLDDGNEMPGFFLDWDQASESYILYEEGYGSE